MTGFNPYGYKILQTFQEVLGKAGGVIDVIVNPDTGTEYLRLNTKSVTPRNDLKTRGMGSPAAMEAERAAARAARATSRKRKTRKAGKAAPAAPAAEPEAQTATA